MLSLTGVITSPILSQIDLSLMDYLQRKISSDIFENHMYSDIRILEILEDLGVVFLVPHTVIIKSLYSVLSCLEQFKEDEELNMIQKSFSEWYYSASSSRVTILFGYLTGR